MCLFLLTFSLLFPEGSSNNLQYRTERIKIPSTPRYPRSMLGSERGEPPLMNPAYLKLSWLWLNWKSNTPFYICSIDCRHHTSINISSRMLHCRLTSICLCSQFIYLFSYLNLSEINLFRVFNPVLSSILQYVKLNNHQMHQYGTGKAIKMSD